jgi:hypothetical protein
MSGEDGQSGDANNAREGAASRRDQDREHLRGLLLMGASSEPGPPLDSAYFDMLRGRISAGSTGN